MTLWQKVVKYIKCLVHFAARNTYRAEEDSVVVYLTPAQRAEEQRKVNKFYSDVLAGTRLSPHGKALELALIASRIAQLDKSIAQAKRNGKRQSDFKAERNRLCNRRSVLEAGQ